MSPDAIRRIVEEIEYRRARRIRRRQLLPHLTAVYARLCSGGRDALVMQRVYFTGSFGEEIPVSLGVKGLAIVDALVRRYPAFLSAAQIEHILHTDPISERLGPQRVMRRTVIRVYVHRVRKTLARALHRKGIDISPERLLVSDSTELASAKAHRLAVPCKIVYLREAS